MTTSSFIFWLIFVLPLIGFLIWLMRQDKQKGKIGLVILAAIVVGVIVYMYFYKQFDTSTPLPN